MFIFRVDRWYWFDISEKSKLSINCISVRLFRSTCDMYHLFQWRGIASNALINYVIAQWVKRKCMDLAGKTQCNISKLKQKCFAYKFMHNQIYAKRCVDFLWLFNCMISFVGPILKTVKILSTSSCHTDFNYNHDDNTKHLNLFAFRNFLNENSKLNTEQPAFIVLHLWIYTCVFDSYIEYERKQSKVKKNDIIKKE